MIMETQPEPVSEPQPEPEPVHETEPVSMPESELMSLSGPERVSVPRPEPESVSTNEQTADEGCQTVEFEVTLASPAPADQASWEVVSPDAPSPRPESEAQATTPVGDFTANNVQRSSPDHAGSVEAAASSLFAISKPINPGFSMFGTTSTVPVASTSDIADQVRFGFSHIPKTTGSSAVQHEPVASEHHASPSPYPVPHVPAKFADMESYVDTAEVEMETAEFRDVSPQPPTVESFDRGGWEMHTHYHDVEGGHFEGHALIDGTRVGAEEPSLHSDAILPEMVPKGFDSYGAHENPATAVSLDDAENHSVDSPEDESRQQQELVENFETQGRVDDEIGVDRDDDVEYDEYGDEIEDGDYDQREYNVPADDDEGLSNEDDELEQETAERYGEGDVYNADEEGDYAEDEYGEEGYDEDGESEGSYESEDDSHQQSPGAAYSAPPKEPVVISLLSDSEDDDDEPPAPPSKQASSPCLTPKGASIQERPMVTVHVNPAAEAVTEMAPQHEINHQTGDHDDLNSSENQLPAANDAVAEDSIAHKKSHPQVLGETIKKAVSSSAGQSQSPKEIEAADGSEFITEPQVVMADDESQGSGLDSDSDQEVQDLQNNVGRVEKIVAQWESDEDVDADADADQELEDEFMNIPDEDGDDENGFSNEEDKGSSEEIMDEIEEEAEVEDDEMEIIEIEDEEELDQEVDRPASVMEEDAVGSPMEVEGVSVPQVDSEMREASAEVNADNGSMRDAVSPELEQFEPVSTESKDHEPGPTREDVSMDDVSMPSPEAGLQSHPHVTGSGSVEMNGSDQAVLDNQGSKDDGGDVVCTSKVMIQKEEQTQKSVFNNEVVSIELSESTKVVTHSHQTKHSAIAPSSPPLTQPAQLRSDSESPPDVSRTSNKNDRPLPLLTPTESFITTQPNHVPEPSDIEFSGHIVAASPKPEMDYFNQPGDESGNTQPMHVSEPDDTGMLAESPDQPNVDETLEEDSTVSAPSPVSSAVVDQPATPARSKESAEGETIPLAGSPSSANELERSQPGPAEQEAEEKSVASESGTSSPARYLRVTRSGQTPRISKTDSIRDEITVSSPYSEDRGQDQEQNQEQSQASEASSSPDLSINLARQSVAAKRSKKGAEPLRTSPRITRGRSNSLQMSVTSEIDDDPSISFARASLASPSKFHTTTTTEAPVATTTSLKTELTKGLRKLPECVSLKNIKNHVDKHPNVVAIVASKPTTPSRAKGGPREYMMSFNVTDPSIAPLHVVEVQLYRPHKESLPLVKPGDAILLQGFQVKSLSKKGFGLRTGSDSAWAVYEELSSGIGEDGAEELPPQIKGPPVEDYADYSPYMTTLKAWYRSLENPARNKLDKAVQKFEELGVGNSQK